MIPIPNRAIQECGICIYEYNNQVIWLWDDDLAMVDYNITMFLWGWRRRNIALIIFIIKKIFVVCGVAS